MSQRFRNLVKQLESEVAERSYSLSQGGASSFENYRKTVGEIQGLQLAIDNLKLTLKEADDD